MHNLTIKGINGVHGEYFDLLCGEDVDGDASWKLFCAGDGRCDGSLFSLLSKSGCSSTSSPKSSFIISFMKTYLIIDYGPIQYVEIFIYLWNTF